MPIDPKILGSATSAFFGARAEARIVRTVVPVVPVDITAEYPTVNANLDTSSLPIARELVVRDVTNEVRETLRSAELFAHCFDRRFWRRAIGVTLVEIERSEGSVLPVRALYDAAANDPGLGVNPLYYDGSLWYALPDVIYAALVGPVPPIRRALRLVGRGVQRGLRQVRLRGTRYVDPREADPFVAMVEERLRIRNDPTLAAEERDRLELFLKITANSGSYGVQARFDRHELAHPVELVVHGPDDIARVTWMDVVEDPGPYAFPPIAASITAGGRLMLGLAQKLVEDAGGHYAMCDTDALAIVSTKEGGWIECESPDGSGRIRALSHDEVRAILVRFESLNPYDRALVPDLWKVVHGSLEHRLLAYVISAKRYVLFRRNPTDIVEVSAEDDGEVVADEELADWTEHGLGQFLDPLPDDDPSRPNRDVDGRRVWVKEAWRWVLERAHGEDPPLPEWAERYALSQFSLSSPTIAGWFRGRDARLDRVDRMRPGTFGLLAHPNAFMKNLYDHAWPAAPYERDPRCWTEVSWYDRRNAQPIRVRGLGPNASADEAARAAERGEVVVLTLGDVLRRYETRPEHKSLAPDGSPATGTTCGLLRRRPVRSTPALTHLAGKEGNKLLERVTGEVTRPEDYRSDYGTREDTWPYVAAVLRMIGREKVACLAELDPSTVWRAIQDATNPRRASTRAKLSAAAAAFAHDELRRRGLQPANDPTAVLSQLLAAESATSQTRVCECGCGKELGPRRRRWYSNACRQRALRRAQPTPGST